MLGNKTRERKYLKLREKDLSKKEKIIKSKKNTNSPNKLENYNFSKNSILNKNLIRENENKEKDLEIDSRKLTTTEESEKNSQSTRNNEEKYEKYNKSITASQIRYKRYLKNNGYINKDFEKIPKKDNDKNNKITKKNFVLSINLYNTLNNKESRNTINKTNSIIKNVLNNDNSDFPNSYEDKYNSTDPNRKHRKIINTKPRDNNYKRNNHIDNYFYINNELFNITSDSNKNYDTISNISGKTYNRPKIIQKTKSCRSMNQLFIQIKNNEVNNNYIKDYRFAKTFMLYIEKLYKVYLLKNIYHFFYCLKNMPSINKNKRVIFVNRRKFNKNTFNSSTNCPKNNLTDNVIDKIKNKVINTTPECNNQSEMYRNYQELIKSREKIQRRKNKDINENSALANNNENKYKEKDEGKVINRIKNQLYNIKNNNPRQKIIDLNTIKKNNQNKITLIEKIRNIENKITINIKYMNMNFDSGRNTFRGRLRICREYSCHLKGNKNKNTHSMKKKISAGTLNTINKIRLDAIKEEEETKGEI